MDRPLVIGILALLALRAAPSQDTGQREGVSRAPTDSVEATILAMERQAVDSTRRGDTARLKMLLADDFIGIGPNGRMKTKTELLDWTESRKIIFESIETSDIRVRVYGETAVVTGTGKIKAHKDLKDIHTRYRYTRVWIKKQGRWQMASFQATRIVEPRSGLTPGPQESHP